MKLSKKTREELDRLITVREAAALMGVSEGVIWKHIYRKHLSSYGFPTSVDPDDVRRIIIRKGRGRPKS